jgi:lysophospholipase L1-like esterase
MRSLQYRRLAFMLNLLFCLGAVAAAPSAAATPAAAAPNWVTAWTASAQGPYPSGYPSAQPNLSFAFPDPATGAHDQSFRLIVRPDVWAPSTRLRFTNAFGTKPVTFDNAYAGEYAIAGTLVPDTNMPVRFGGAVTVTVAPGQSVWSDPVALPFVHGAGDAALIGRKLAVSFHVAGESGPMTWHAKALTTSYVTAPGAGIAGGRDDDAAFTFATASWFFLDAVDMAMPAGTRLVVALADSITDGTDSTMNGDDRWPDQLSRRLHAAYGSQVAIVNEGIGGNRITGPAVYTPAQPFAGGPAAVQRLDRDVTSLSGVSTVIIFEGINDFGTAGEGATPQLVEAALTDIVKRLRKKIPGVRVIGATLTSALASTNPMHGSPAEDAERRSFNTFVRGSKLFDAVIDFDAVTLDPQTGSMKAEFVPDNTVGGPGDKLHPNRAGYQAMANAIELRLLAP